MRQIITTQPTGCRSPFGIARRAGGDPLAGYNWAARLQMSTPPEPLGLWQDVAMTIPATLDFDPIAACSDELSTSAVVTQPNPDLQPILFNSAWLPSAAFDGSDDFLGGVVVASTTVYTVAIVIERAASVPGSHKVAVSYGQGAFANTLYLGADPSGFYIASFSAAENDLPSTTIGGRVVMVAEVNAGTLTWWLNGTLVGTTSANVNPRTSNALQLGRWGGSLHYDGSIFFAGVIDGLLSSGERASLEAALTDLFL